MQKQKFSWLKGVGGLNTLVVELLIAGIAIAAALLILVAFQAQMTVNSFAYNATGTIISAIVVLVGFVSTIVVIYVAAIMLGLVSGFGGGARGGGRR